MDKIYTRKKIRLPSVKILGFTNGRRNEPKRKLATNMIVILIVAMITLFTVIKSISPIIDRVCEDAAKTKATIISNNMATEVMKKYTYDDFIKIYRDANRKCYNDTI